MLSYSLRVFGLLVVALIYAGFDVFNKRNVPNTVVYATVAVGFLFSITYPLPILGLDLLLALAIGSLGYVAYKTGFLGAGDIYEFVALSLIMPIQPSAYLTSVQQYQLPFIFSVLVTAGYAAVIMMPIYYLVFTKKNREAEKRGHGKKSAFRALTLLVSYLLLLTFIEYSLGISVEGLVLMVVFACAASLISYYGTEINSRMVEFVYPSKLEEGDMLALNLMTRKEISFFKSKSRKFGRLVERSFLKDTSKIRKKVPVYRNSIPLALFVLIGTILSILVGNILFLFIT